MVEGIILTSRNLENGERALAILKNKYPNTDFDLHQLDITFQSSRKTLILWVEKKYEKIDVLVNIC